MNLRWDPIADRVFQCRLTFCDVTVGIVAGSDGVLVVDTGTTLAEARAIDADIAELTRQAVTHVLLTHNHFDHILGYSVFAHAVTHCAPAVAAAMAGEHTRLRDDAVRHGADPAEVDAALTVLRAPKCYAADGVIDLGDRLVTIAHPGRGHTDHDLIAVVSGAEHRVEFCGDLIEESADPCVDTDSHLSRWPVTLEAVRQAGGAAARYVPGHGAPVDAAFLGRQAHWLAGLL